MRTIAIFAVLVTTTVFADEPQPNGPALRVLEQQGVLVKGVRTGSNASPHRVTYLGLGKQWKGSGAALNAIPGHSVMLLSIHDNPRVSDATLQSLRGLDVKYVKLTNVNVTNAGVEQIASMTGIKTLSLKKVAITDDAIPALAKLQSLERLNLWGTALSPEGVAKLRIALPNCKIYASWW